MCVTLRKVTPDPSHAEWMSHGGQGHCEVIHMTASLNPFKHKHINTHMVQNQEGVVKRCQNLVIISPHPSTHSIIQKTHRSVTTYLFLKWKANIHRKGTVDFKWKFPPNSLFLNLMAFRIYYRGGHNRLPLISIHTYVNVGDRKHKLMRISLYSKLQVWWSLACQLSLDDV